ncbi:hypothetical protein ABTX34_27220 [Streptomyces sp. NPDC096538]
MTTLSGGDALAGPGPIDRAPYTLQTAVIGARLLDWPRRPL